MTSLAVEVFRENQEYSSGGRLRFNVAQDSKFCGGMKLGNSRRE